MAKTFKHLVLVLVIVLVVVHSAFSQQNFQFSQYMFNGLVINPAYAGCDEALSLTFYNRSQWTKLEGAPKTQTLSAHTLFSRQHVGSGLTIINDRIGVHQNLMITGAASYHLKVAKASYVSFGVQAGLSHRESDYQSLGVTMLNDPKVAATSIAQNQLDFGAGIYFRSPRLHIGISAPQLMPGKMDINDTLSVTFNKMQGFLFSKVKLNLTTGVVLEPGFLLKYYPDVPLSFDVNANIVFHKVLIIGISYRKKESIDFLLRAQVTPQLQLGYGYDHVIGDASALSQASHELMVNYLFRFTRNNLSSPR